MPLPDSRPRRRGFGVEWGGITGGIWLIGIAVLAVTGWWWPGVLVLIGLSALISGLAAGDGWQRWGSIQGAIFMLGLAAIAALNWWWPGVLVLVGLIAILSAIIRPKL
jgi:hypothetical protein